jgi:hypothetical protein
LSKCGAVEEGGGEVFEFESGGVIVAKAECEKELLSEGGDDGEGTKVVKAMSGGRRARRWRVRSRLWRRRREWRAAMARHGGVAVTMDRT